MDAGPVSRDFQGAGSPGHLQDLVQIQVLFHYLGYSGQRVVDILGFLRGNEAKVPKLAGKTLEAIESEYGEQLKDWDGNLDNLRGSRDILTQHLLKR